MFGIGLDCCEQIQGVMLSYFLPPVVFFKLAV